MVLSSRITLEELAALNDEIVALTRAGVPLAQGLRSVSGDMSGRLGKLAARLSEQLESGQGLVQALEKSDGSFPPVYVAVVAAGVRCGRLPAALESVSRTVRRVSELRRVVIASLLYPLIVLLIASGLFSFTMFKTAPPMLRVYEGLELSLPTWYERIMSNADVVQRGIGLFWVVLVAALLFWLYRSGRSFRGSDWKYFPTPGRVLRAGRLATFAELLALMVEQRVPMDEAVTLSGAASGDATLARSGRLLAEQIRSGGVGAEIPQGLPPLLGWLILTGSGHDQLVKLLRQAGSAYRRKASYWGTWLAIYMPILLSASLGGFVVLFYVLLVLAPFYNLLYQLC